MLSFIGTIIRSEFALAFRRPAGIVFVVFFFVVATSLFPFGAGPRVETLRALAPAALMISALFASLLSLPNLFAEDGRDGTLEQYLLGASPLAFAVFGKIVAHWIVFGVPLALIAPILASQFDLPENARFTLSLTLLVGTPALSGIGALGAALTLGLRGGPVLLSLLTLPLYIPVLVFGAGAVESALAGLSAEAALSFLAALSLAGIFLTPPLVAAAIRIALE